MLCPTSGLAHSTAEGYSLASSTSQYPQYPGRRCSSRLGPCAAQGFQALSVPLTHSQVPWCLWLLLLHLLLRHSRVGLAAVLWAEGALTRGIAALTPPVPLAEGARQGVNLQGGPTAGTRTESLRQAPSKHGWLTHQHNACAARYTTPASLDNKQLSLLLLPTCDVCSGGDGKAH